MVLRVPGDTKPQPVGPSPLPAVPTTISAPTPIATSAADPASTPPSPPGAYLIDVGFWADPRDAEDQRPHPARLVDEEWGETVAARAVALYALSGFLESFELGYSFCRLGCGSGGDGGEKHGKSGDGSSAAPGGGAAASGPADRSMGCCTLTDGKYVWPEGLAHYVLEHAVRPPEDFIARALRNLRALRAAQAGGRLLWEVEDGGRTAPLAPGTASFLRDSTTLGIALPPEPETRRRSGSGGVCSCMLS